MRLVTVDNIVLQFDNGNDEDVTQEMVDAFIDLINNEMSNAFPFSNPTISRIKRDNTIIVTDVEIDED